MNFKKPLKFFILPLFSVFFLHFLIVFIFLNTPVFKKVVDLDPATAQIDIGFGYSLIPGKIHLKNVTLQVQDPNMHLTVKMNGIFASVDLSKLTKKKLVFSELIVTGADVGIHVRTEKEHEDYLARNPRKGPNERDKTWELFIPNVEIDSIEKIQVADFILDGVAQVRGGFHLWPGIEAEIFHSCLETHNAVLKNWAKLESFKGCVVISKFDVPTVKGNAVFDYMTGRLETRGLALTYQSLQNLVDVTKSVEFSGPEAPFEAVFDLKQGQFTPQSKLHMEGQKIFVNGPAFKLNGDLKVDWIFAEKGHALNLLLSDLSVFLKERTLSIGKIAKIPITMKSKNLRARNFLSTYDLNMRTHGFCFSTIEDPTAPIKLKSCGELRGESHGKIGLLEDLRLIAELNVTEAEVHFSEKPFYFKTAGKFILSSEINLPKKISPTTMIRYTHTKSVKDAKSSETQLNLKEGWNSTIQIDRFNWNNKNLTGSLKTTLSDNYPVIDALSELDVINWPLTSVVKSTKAVVQSNFQYKENAGLLELKDLEYLSENGIKANGELYLAPEKVSGKIKIKLWPITLGMTLKSDETKVEWFPKKVKNEKKLPQ